jgi:glycosyltransferase involved in cell wall biosynthesis
MEMEQPLGRFSTRFTILLPVFRPPAMLPYAIESVLAQTQANFELFVVGDGAPSATLDCARGYAARDPRIKVFPFRKGAMCGEEHLHTVLADAAGEYVAHIADDDLWFPNHLEEMEKLLHEVDFGHLPYVCVNADGSIDMLPSDLTNARLRQRILHDNRFLMDHGILPYVYVNADGSIDMLPSDLTNARLRQRILQDNRFLTDDGILTAVYCTLSYSVTGYSLASYRRLPVGWAPSEVMAYPDLKMWRKFLCRDDMKFGTRMAITALNFATDSRADMSLGERGRENERWWRRICRAEERADIVEKAWQALVHHAVLNDQQAEDRLWVVHDLRARLARLEELLDRRLPIGGTIDFSETGNSPLYVKSGWGDQEPQLRWTDGGDAVLRVRLEFPPHQASNRVRMRFRAYSFGCSQRVSISVEGQEVGELSVDGAWRDHEIEIVSQRLLAGQELEMVFTLPDAHSPKSVGQGEDARSLGIAMASMTFLPAARRA